MSMDLIRSIGFLENSDESHLCRVLLLLSESKTRNGYKSVDGITKLAKLDFLLRYPNCLNRAMSAIGKTVNNSSSLSYEENTIESKMIRFRYGPWDRRYRRWIGILFSKGLVETYMSGRTVHVVITDKGNKLSETISSFDEFLLIRTRSSLVQGNFGSYSGTKLMNFIYDVFPELSTMKWGEEIVL
jgi:predicted transcriptional regulator